jgi:hypothetical protein
MLTVENKRYRKVLKHTFKFLIKTVCSVILAMTCSVEEILAAKMKAACRVSIVHDAWSKFGEHYFALLATYMATRETVIDGVMSIVAKPVMSLLSVAPLHTPVKEGGDDDGSADEADVADVTEACEFTAQVHCDHITDILSNFYCIEDVGKWITNQTADSPSVKLKLAKLLGIPHMNCENHLLNNKLKLWFKNTTFDDDEIIEHSRTFSPGTICKLIHQTMLDLSKTNKNRAILLQNTDLAPTIGNETRWASARNMMNKWQDIEDACELASAKDSVNILMPPTTYYFKRAAKNMQSMLNDINSVPVILQTSVLPLYKCQEIQEVLMVTAEEGRLALANPWYRNSFGKVYISSKFGKRPDKHLLMLSAKCRRGRHTP